MEREFKRGEILVKLFPHLATSPSSPWRWLEIAGSLQDWLEARKDFFPDPRIHHTIEAERQRALGEFAASMRRPPAPSSARLSSESGGGFPAHGLAPDQPSPLLPTPNPVPDPVPESFMDELPPHPNPVSGTVPEGFLDEPPPHPNPVPGSVPEGFMDEPPPHPDPVPGSVPEGSQAKPPSHFVPVREGLVDGLPPLPAPVPGPVLTNCLHPWFPFRRSSWRTCLHFLFLSMRGARTHPPCLLCLGGSAADLHGLARGPSGLCTIRLGSSGLCTMSLSATVGSPGHAAGLLIPCLYVAGLLIAGSARDGLQADCLNSGSARDGLRAGRLNSGSAGDGLRARRLNSGASGVLPQHIGPTKNPPTTNLFQS
ncbi:hypothetical protein CRENBAI_021661 [Crenichthys baileyi]|uniref:Uncharacterized protein n=1 Tax=Crenichthys baileyi TaxID=28760 RepID=A0AAV9RIF9_9TELE